MTLWIILVLVTFQSALTIGYLNTNDPLAEEVKANYGGVGFRPVHAQRQEPSS